MTFLFRATLRVLLAFGCALPCGAAPERIRPQPGTSLAVVPTQFIAKLFTEGLGRAPSAQEWVQEYAFFDGEGRCAVPYLSEAARRIFTSPEFESLGYAPGERVFALNRAVLSSNPAQWEVDGLGYLLTRPYDPLPWSVVLDAVLASPAFAALVPEICNTAGADPADYGFGTVPHPQLPADPLDPGFPGGSGAQLQALLDAASPGSTVWLARGSLTVISEILRIPEGVTVATTGLPPRQAYAKLGRLVSAESYPGDIADALIELHSGAQLRSVFLDGNLGRASRLISAEDRPFFVGLLGGYGSAVRDSRFGASRTHNVLGVAARSRDGRLCRDVAVTGNLFTGYGGRHHPITGLSHREQLGVETACSSTLVGQNEFVDMTDNAIAAYSVDGGRQASRIEDNRILQAGNSAYSGIALDANVGSFAARVDDWRGFIAARNEFAGNPRVHTDTLIAVGTGEYRTPDYRTMGRGAAVVDNRFASDPTRRNRVNIRITTQGMLDAVQRRNLGPVTVEPTGIWCRSGDHLAAVSAGRASGRLELPLEDTRLDNCMWHGEVAE